eukprot:380741-Lingulodinium_polyedra.AAC.1
MQTTASGTCWSTSAARPTFCTLRSSTYLRRRTNGHNASAQPMGQMRTMCRRAHEHMLPARMAEQ